MSLGRVKALSFVVVFFAFFFLASWSCQRGRTEALTVSFLFCVLVSLLEAKQRCSLDDFFVRNCGGTGNRYFIAVIVVVYLTFRACLVRQLVSVGG